MDPISLEDLALLEILQKVDQHMPPHSGDSEVRQRLIDSGLAEIAEDDTMRLTTAGIELCKSLQHRVAADAAAAKIRAQKEADEAAEGRPAAAGS